MTACFDFDPDCRTTAMGIMPHKDIDRALSLARSLDIPFWPQLPKVTFYEDMYVQASERFPGITIDEAGQRVLFDTRQFETEMTSLAESLGDPAYYRLSKRYSHVYDRFLGLDLGRYPSVRGQITGPVSFGFRVVDETQRPIIYNDEIRSMLFDFIRSKWNVQVEELRAKNRNAFVWADEPGLGWIFSGMSGYGDIQAREEYRAFLQGVEGPKALHLCANVNLPYLLSLGTELVSFDAYQIETMPRAYAASVSDFLKADGTICWGIVPTDSTSLEREDATSLSRLLLGYWDVISRETGVEPKHIASRALLAPARCCLKNIGLVGAADETGSSRSRPAGSVEEQIVEKAFSILKAMAADIRDRLGL